MKSSLLAIVACISVGSVSAQPVLKWAKPLSGKAQITNMVDNNQGEIFLSGFFSGKTDFDPSEKSNVMEAQSGNEIFFAKYNANGELNWVYQIGQSSSISTNMCMSIDATNNIYLAGATALAGDLDPSDKKAKLNKDGGFIAKYTSEGSLVWMKKWDGSTLFKVANITTDIGGNIYLSGSFSGAVNFATSGPKQEATTTGSDWDLFVAKYSSEGNLAWVKTISGNADEQAVKLALDSENNLCLLWTSNSQNLAGDLAQGLSKNEGNCALVSKYTNTGNHFWTKPLGDINFGGPTDNLAVDATDNVIVSGVFKKDNLKPGGSKEAFNSNLGSEDIFLLKYNNAGALLWSRTLGSSGNDACPFMNVSKNGDIYLSGVLSANASTTVSGKSVELKANSKDILLAQYNANGDCLAALLVGDKNEDRPSCLHASNNNHLYLMGSTDGTINLNLTGGKAEISNTPFFAKYGFGLVAAEVTNPNTNGTNGTRTGAVKE